MKNLILLLFAFTAFSQPQKTETHEPLTTSYIEDKGRFLASSEVFADRAEIVFFDRNTHDNVILGFTLAEFTELGKLLTNYDQKDKDFYLMEVNGATLYVRFVEKYNYVKSHIQVKINNDMWYFPPMNRQQYKRLFSI